MFNGGFGRGGPGRFPDPIFNGDRGNKNHNPFDNGFRPDKPSNPVPWNQNGKPFFDTSS